METINLTPPEALPDHDPDFYPYRSFGKYCFMKGLWFNSYNIGMHYHDYCEINFVTNGEGYHYFGKNRFEVKKGAFFIIPPNMKHGYLSTRGLDVFHVIIDSDYLRSLYPEISGIREWSYIFNYTPELKHNYNFNYMLNLSGDRFYDLLRICRKIIQIAPGEAPVTVPDNTGNLLLKGLLFELISIVCTCYRDQIDSIVGESASEGIMPKIITYILDNVDGELSIDSICHTFGYSQSTLMRYFKKELNTSPAKFILLQRINHAKQLLTNTDMPITEIGNTVGFFDSAHFIKSFKKTVGMTPKQYRKQG